VIDPGHPYTKTELARAISHVHEQSVAFVDAMSDAVFMAPQGQAWSPQEHVRHLTRGVRPLVRAFELPRPALLRFGWSFRASRDFATMVRVYRDQLAAGATAGRFTPSAARPDGSIDEWRRTVMARWTDAVGALAHRTMQWSEWGLDRFQLPHPLLGTLTVREMLEFTAYHNAHHINRVIERHD
jgi:hypothetical protein